MADCPYPDTVHRWNWFRRRQWWPDYRDRMLAVKGGSCGIVLEVMGGPQGRTVLDATCGLGRKTLILHHLGATVVGADASAYAVERARELAAAEGVNVPFFVSPWRDLPGVLSERFDAVIIDAFIDCCETTDDLLASCTGIASVLKPGGVFTCFGLEWGESMEAVLQEAWAAGEPFYLDGQHSEGGCECTYLRVRTRGPDFIDDHHLYVVGQDDSPPHLEHGTVRQWFRWDRACMEAAMLEAGFKEIRTQVFQGYGFGGGTIERVIARKADR